MEIARTYVEPPRAEPRNEKIDVQELIALRVLRRQRSSLFEHPTYPNQPLSPAAESDRPFPAERTGPAQPAGGPGSSKIAHVPG